MKLSKKIGKKMVIIFILIRYRREYHDYFEDHSIRDHSFIWMRIANRININYNFIVTANQCRNKWFALKRGESFAICNFICVNT